MLKKTIDKIRNITNEVLKNDPENETASEINFHLMDIYPTCSVYKFVGGIKGYGGLWVEHCSTSNPNFIIKLAQHVKEENPDYRICYDFIGDELYQVDIVEGKFQHTLITEEFRKVANV